MANPNPEREQDEWGEGEGKDDRYVLVVGFAKGVGYQFVRVRQNKEGSIYVGFAYRGYSPHFSYHASGETHMVARNQEGERLPFQKTQAMPIAQFRDSYSLGSWSVVNSDFSIWKVLTPEKERKIQALFCFDMSSLTGLLNINFDLLERERFDLLSKMTTSVPANLNPRILVITATNPWIVVRAMTV